MHPLIGHDMNNDAYCHIIISFPLVRTELCKIKNANDAKQTPNLYNN